MQPISNSSGFESAGEESGQIRNSKSSAEIKQYYKELIAKANSVPIKILFKVYGVKATEHNPIVTCPFLKHSGGRERSPSFKYYPETNSFWCYGCKTGNHPVNFVANMDNISVSQAAIKILELHGSDATLDDSENDYTINYSERLEVLMELSDFVREFIQSHNDNPRCIAYIEKLAGSFDLLYSKHNLDNGALKQIIAKIKNKVSNYNICQKI